MRRIPLSHRSHVIGFQSLSTGHAEHESALERDFVTLSSFQDADAVITAQPITLAFKHDGQARRYTPDFLVRWSSGRVDLVEIKYRRDLRAGWPSLRPGFIAARQWADEQGARFRIATERGIRGPRLEAAKQLLPLRSAPMDVELAEQAMTHAKLLGDPTFEGLVAVLPCGRAAALAVVWRLVARGMLSADLAQPIGQNTRLRAP